MKGCLVLFVSLLAVTSATKGFTYNDDLVCGYPFEDLVIESITCTPSTFIHVLPDGGQQANLYDSDEVCAFGNQMDIVGRVTISQMVIRNYFVNLKVCFRTSEASWYSSKKCMLFKSSIDLRTSIEQVQQEEEQAAAAAADGISLASIDYVEPGVFTFSARVIIPKKTFVFNADYMVAAELSLVPASKSVYEDTYKFTSVCTATFNAIYDESEWRFSNAYAAATVAAVGLLCSAYYAGGKSRRLCTGSCDNDNENDFDNDFVEMNKIDESIENEIVESEVPISPSDVNIVRGQRSDRKSFPGFFRRQAKEKKYKRSQTQSSTMSSESNITQRDHTAAVYLA